MKKKIYKGEKNEEIRDIQSEMLWDNSKKYNEMYCYKCKYL